MRHSIVFAVFSGTEIARAQTHPPVNSAGDARRILRGRCLECHEPGHQSNGMRLAGRSVPFRRLHRGQPENRVPVKERGDNMSTTKRSLIALALLTALGTSATACGQEDSPDRFEGQPGRITDQEHEDARPPGREGGSTCDTATSVVPEPPPQCGKWGQICCGQPGAGVCDIDNVCLEFDNWCSPRFTTTCTSTSQCRAGLVCEFNYCLSCGVTGYECCEDNSCNTTGVKC